MKHLLSIAACLLVTAGITHAFPVAVNDEFTVLQNVTSYISASSNDLREGIEELLVYESVSDPSHGTIAWDEYSIEYTPTQGYVGDDSFTYTVRDSQNRISNMGTVILHVGNRPIIEFVANDPSILEKGQSYDVQVNVTSTNSPIASVTWNGQPLSFSNGSYRGTFNAPMVTGSYEASVIASAVDGTSATGTGYYWVYPVYHVLGRSLSHPVASSNVAYYSYFQLSGKVTSATYSQFVIDDASGTLVTCWRVAHGLAVGDHVTVTGSPIIFSPTEIYFSIPSNDKVRKDN